MGGLLILYLTGAITNVFILFLFRSEFTYDEFEKKLFAWICSTAAVLSFILWMAIAIVVIMECVKYFGNNKDDKKTTTMLR